MKKTNFDSLIKEMKRFEKKANFEKTSKKELLKWLKKEIKEYETAKTKSKKSDKLMDTIILIIQIAKRDNISLDAAWKKWWVKSKKYLK